MIHLIPARVVIDGDTDNAGLVTAAVILIIVLLVILIYNNFPRRP